MSDENLDELCKDCGPTFTAFLEEMAAHNKEKNDELGAKVVCPTCGRVHEYTPDAADRASRPRAS
jgi:uncharacterized Zn finger protein